MHCDTLKSLIKIYIYSLVNILPILIIPVQARVTPYFHPLIFNLTIILFIPVRAGRVVVPGQGQAFLLALTKRFLKTKTYMYANLCLQDMYVEGIFMLSIYILSAFQYTRQITEVEKQERVRIYISINEYIWVYMGIYDYI